MGQKVKTQISCAICLDDFKNNQMVAEMPGCVHIFHKDCVEQWLQQSPTCVMCRQDVVRDPAVGKFKVNVKKTSKKLLKRRGFARRTLAQTSRPSSRFRHSVGSAGSLIGLFNSPHHGLGTTSFSF